jgi:hypothetical protein
MNIQCLMYEWTLFITVKRDAFNTYAHHVTLTVLFNEIQLYVVIVRHICSAISIDIKKRHP